MPFTFSHPAIVLPLINRYSKWFSATGLIIGSMTPDFESFILVTDDKIFGHRWSGSLYFDIPLGLMLMFLYHGVVRDPLIANLPMPLQERCDKYRGFQWGAYFRKHYMIIISSLFIGILSHLLWDAFTHLNLRYPDARYSKIKVFGKRLYIILQYGSSVIGLAAVVWAAYKVPRIKVRSTSGVKYIYWLVATLLSVLFGVILITVAFKDVDIWPILYLYIVLSSAMYALIVVSLVYSLFGRQQLRQ